MADLATSTSYPIALAAERPESPSRFWAIPIVGIFVKGIILIPHYIILYVLYLVVLLAHLVIWVPVLFGGRYPDWAFGLNAGLLRWYSRVTLYTYGLSDKYPEFAMQAPGDVDFVQPETSNRLWAIPLLGIVVKYIILIPHFIVWYVLAIITGLAHLVIWIPVLFSGSYPDWGFNLTKGLVVYSARLFGYMVGLTDRYPPFSMS
jgi:Domain of unknown function (DUF4389)